MSPKQYGGGEFKSNLKDLGKPRAPNSKHQRKPNSPKGADWGINGFLDECMRAWGVENGTETEEQNGTAILEESL